MSDYFVQAFEKLGDKLYGWFEAAVTMAPNFLLAVIVVVLAGFASRWIGRGARKGFKRVVDNDGLVTLLTSIVRVAVVALGLFIALSLMQLERTVTSLLAGLGVVGLALGFAFQDIAANFMSGAMLAVRGPFEVGDIIEVDGHVGEVQNIELRRTTLRTFDGLTVVIPNKEIFQQTLVNYTQTEERRVDVTVGVAYGDDLERAREVVRGALEQVPERDESREVDVFFTEFGSSSINFEARVWLAHAEQRAYMRARSEAIIAIKKALDEAGLTIPFPIRTLDFGADVVGGRRLDELGLDFGKPELSSQEAASAAE